MKKSFKQLCEGKGYKVYYDNEVIAKVPAKQEGELDTFKLDRWVSDDELEEEYSGRGLIPADPCSVLEYWDGERDLATHWKNKDGKWCYSAFRRWFGKRYVSVHRNDSLWDDSWWFVGLRKSPQNSDTKNSSDPVSLDLISRKYRDTETGIEAVIENGKVSIYNSRGRNNIEFVFKNSDKETVEKVAQALLRIVGLLG